MILTSIFDKKEFGKYFKNTVWLMTGRLLQGLVSLFMVAYVARYLGPENYGSLSYAISFVSIFATLAALGLDQIIIRDLVNSIYPRDVLLSTAFKLKICGAFMTWLLILGTLFYGHVDHFTALMVLIISAGLFFQSFNVIDLYFQSKVMSPKVVFAQTAQLVISTMVRVCLILNHAPLLWFAVVILIESIVLSIGLMIAFKSVGLTLKVWEFDFKTAKDLLKNSYPLILSGIALSVYMRIDQIMIKSTAGMAALGNYSAAVNLCELWYAIPVIIAASLFPAIVESKKQGEAFYHDRLQKLYDLMFILSFIISIVMMFAGPLLVTILFGKSYSAAASVVPVYIWVNIFAFLGSASEKWLINENLTGISFYRTLSGAFFNIVLNLLFIRKYGITGAAWAALISQMIAVFSIVLFSKTRPMALMMLKSMFIFHKKSFINNLFSSKA